MNHEVASGKLLELAFGELTPREARAVEAHAAACEACRAELAEIRETRALMAALPVEPPPERGMGIVLAAAREAAAARARSRSILPAWLWAGGIGAVAVAAVAVVSWQLAKTTPEGALRDDASELLGRAPAVAVAPEAAPGRGPSNGIAPSPPPGERVGGKGPAAPAEAPPSPTVAKRTVAPSTPAAPERDEAYGSLAAPGAEPLGSGSSAGIAPSPPPGERVGVRGQAAPATGGAKWDRAEPLPPPPRAAESQPAPATPRRAFADEERAPAAPAAQPPAPSPAQKGRSMAPAERKAAAPAMAEAEERAEVHGVETRSFPGCPGERRRVVERDDDGRVIRYVRVGDRRTVEQRYGRDGRLRSAFALEDGVRRDLPLDAPGLVLDARDAGIDAPPRCSAP